MKKTLFVIVNVVLWVFLVLSCVITFLAISAQASGDGVPSIGGKCMFTVLTDSMKGEFDKGALIIGKKLSVEEKLSLKEGDVITFLADLDGNGTKEYNTHRIVEINFATNGEVESYVTKGDNNEYRDENPVLWQTVQAKWTGQKVAGLGAVISFMQKPTAFLLIIVLPLFGFFVYEVVMVALYFVNKKKQQKELQPAVDVEAIKQQAIEEYLKQQQLANSESVVEESTEKNSKE